MCMSGVCVRGATPWMHKWGFGLLLVNVPLTKYCLKSTSCPNSVAGLVKSVTSSVINVLQRCAFKRVQTSAQVNIERERRRKERHTEIKQIRCMYSFSLRKKFAEHLEQHMHTQTGGEP